MNPQFWAAVGGTTVGGLITIGLWYLSQRATRRQRAEDLKREREALANSLLFKVTKVCPYVHAVHRHFEETRTQAVQAGYTGEPWQYTLPLTSPPEPIHFTAEEMGLLLGLGDDDVFNDLLELENRQSTVIGAVKAFNADRTALGESIAAVSTDHTASGNKVSGTITVEERNILLPKIVNVNSLIELIHSNARDANVFGRKTADELQTFLRSKLGLKHKLSFDTPIPGAVPEE